MGTIDVQDLIDLVRDVRSNEYRSWTDDASYDIGYDNGVSGVADRIELILRSHGVWEDD